MHRVVLPILSAGLAAPLLLGSCSGGTQASSGQDPPGMNSAPSTASPRPLALVYRGPAGCVGCSGPVAKMLRTSRFHFRVRYVGPHEDLPLVSSSFTGVSLYAQPGGDTSTRAAYRLLRPAGRAAITQFVRDGGRYLGTCQGAYLAGTRYHGLGLLAPGDAGWYIGTKGASTRSDAAAVIPVRWGSRTRSMFFQNGAFIIPSNVPGERVLARYTNGRIAALVRPYGDGRVGVVGPHPEARPSWYREDGLGPYRNRLGLGHSLIDQTMG